MHQAFLGQVQFSNLISIQLADRQISNNFQAIVQFVKHQKEKNDQIQKEFQERFQRLKEQFATKEELDLASTQTFIRAMKASEQFTNLQLKNLQQKIGKNQPAHYRRNDQRRQTFISDKKIQVVDQSGAKQKHVDIELLHNLSFKIIALQKQQFSVNQQLKKVRQTLAQQQKNKKELIATIQTKKSKQANREMKNMSAIIDNMTNIQNKLQRFQRIQNFTDIGRIQKLVVNLELLEKRVEDLQRFRQEQHQVNKQNQIYIAYQNDLSKNFSRYIVEQQDFSLRLNKLQNFAQSAELSLDNLQMKVDLSKVKELRRNSEQQTESKSPPEQRDGEFLRRDQYVNQKQFMMAQVHQLIKNLKREHSQNKKISEQTFNDFKKKLWQTEQIKRKQTQQQWDIKFKTISKLANSAFVKMESLRNQMRQFKGQMAQFKTNAANALSQKKQDQIQAINQRKKKHTISGQSLKKQLQGKLIELKLEFSSQINYLTNKISNQVGKTLTHGPAFSKQLQELRAILQKKADVIQTRKQIGLLQGQISKLVQSMIKEQLNQQQARLARKSWYCLSCDKLLSNYGGKYSKRMSFAGRKDLPNLTNAHFRSIKQ